MRRLIAGGRAGRCVSSLSASSTAVVTALDEPVVTMTMRAFCCHSESRRMMSSSPPSSTSTATVEKDKDKKQGDDVVVSSYWGVMRPQITREDGSVWPWNCFMVNLYTIIFTSIAN